MINWTEILLFALFAPSAVILIFLSIHFITEKKWPFGKRKKKINSGGKFG